MQVFLLITGLVMILLAAELFTNAIEWFGKRLNLNDGAVGSVFAAVGTALPETSVPVIAFLQGGRHSKEASEAGIGAILGAPMMLSTLAMFVTGAAVLWFAAAKRRSSTIHASYKVVGRDLRTFFFVYILALTAALVPVGEVKLGIAALLLLAYGLYVHRTFNSPNGDDGGSAMRPLHFTRRSPRPPKLRWILVQLLSALALIVFGARTFVDSVTVVSGWMGISPLVLSVIITPIATELPEKFNSVTWVHNKKDTLALGNITGAMVFQSSVLPAIGILATGWSYTELGAPGIASIVIALLASSVIGIEMTVRKRLSPYSLLVGGAIYLIYPIYIFGFLHGNL